MAANKINKKTFSSARGGQQQEHYQHLFHSFLTIGDSYILLKVFATSLDPDQE